LRPALTRRGGYQRRRKTRQIECFLIDVSCIIRRSRTLLNKARAKQETTYHEAADVSWRPAGGRSEPPRDSRRLDVQIVVGSVRRRAGKTELQFA
jgi:hypothetical protein